MKKMRILSIAALSAAVVLAACSGGGGGGNITASPDPHSKVFVTSVTGNGNLSTWANAGGSTGLAAGDAICQARANTAGLSGTYKAWLSDDTDDAYCRIHNLTGKKSANCGQLALPESAGPWVRTDGFPFGGPIRNILSPNGIVYAPVRYDEFGQTVPVPLYYFTGTKASGELDTANPCANWTASAADFTIFGKADETVYDWTDSVVNHIQPNFCDFNRRLLCFQAGPGPALPGHTSSGKKVFVTSVSGNGNMSTWADAGGISGILGGDRICRTRAAAAGLTNAANFKAWLSNTAINAGDRITTDGPWVRLDGVKVANNKADLIDGTLFSSIGLTETNVYASYFAFTGTNSNGTAGSSHCIGWTSSAAANNGIRGFASDAGSYWTSFSSSDSCGINSHLYCIED